MNNDYGGDAILSFLNEPELKSLIDFGRGLACSAPLEISPGILLGRYRIEEQIGGGGFGILHRASDPVLEREVVIKIQRTPSLGSGLDEARTTAFLSHPHIVPILDTLQLSSDTWAIVMPRIDGEPISQSTDISRTLELLIQAAEALAHIHSKGFLHQDIKPANILVDRGGNTILCDFGLATSWQAVECMDAGSPPYISPERIRTGKFCPQSDVWSFGVVMYELLSGERPFVGRNKTHLFDAICSGSPKNLRSISPKISRKLTRICLKCLEKIPENRFSSGSDLCSALISARDDSSERLKRIFVVCSVVVTLLLSVLLWFLAEEGVEVRVKEFLTSERSNAFERFNLLPRQNYIDKILLKFISSSDSDIASRARLALDIRQGNMDAISDAITRPMGRDDQFILEIVKANLDRLLPSLELMLESKSYSVRAQGIGILILVSPDNDTLNRELSDLVVRASFLSDKQRDWNQHVEHLLKVLRVTKYEAIRATVLSMFTQFPLRENANRLIESVSLKKSEVVPPEIQSLMDLLCSNLEFEEPLPKSDEYTNQIGIDLVPVSIGGRDYLVANSEISEEQYASLLKDYRVKLDLDFPAAQISWYDAIAWCNRVSEWADLEPCYVRTDRMEELRSTINGKISVTKQPVWECRFENSGYRLPTVAEYKLLVGSVGESGSLLWRNDELLALFANFHNPTLLKCRSKLPNELGLFDISGNVSEWCWDRSESSNMVFQGNESVVVTVTNRSAMGGSYISTATLCDPNDTLWLHPESRYRMIGFRVLRLSE